MRNEALAAERFWPFVDVRGSDDCWQWTRGATSRGYGAFVVGGVQWLAHRFAWTLAHGAIPEGLHILHHCDNPPCVNFRHLFLGTQADNNADRTSKGQSIGISRPGELNPNAKLTQADVATIRAFYADGTATLGALGREYGVTGTNITDIVRGRTWKQAGDQ